MEEHSERDESNRVDAYRREGKAVARSMNAMAPDHCRQGGGPAWRMQAAKQRHHKNCAPYRNASGNSGIRKSVERNHACQRGQHIAADHRPRLGQRARGHSEYQDCRCAERGDDNRQIRRCEWKASANDDRKSNANRGPEASNQSFWEVRASDDWSKQQHPISSERFASNCAQDGSADCLARRRSLRCSSSFASGLDPDAALLFDPVELVSQIVPSDRRLGSAGSHIRETGCCRLDAGCIGVAAIRIKQERHKGTLLR